MCPWVFTGALPVRCKEHQTSVPPEQGPLGSLSYLPAGNRGTVGERDLVILEEEIWGKEEWKPLQFPLQAWPQRFQARVGLGVGAPCPGAESPCVCGGGRAWDGWETGGRRLHGQSPGCHPLLWGWQGHLEKVWAPLFCYRENCRGPPLAAPSEVNCLTICLVQRFPSVPPGRILQPFLRPAPAVAAPETRACVPSSTLCSPTS